MAKTQVRKTRTSGKKGSRSRKKNKSHRWFYRAAVALVSIFIIVSAGWFIHSRYSRSYSGRRHVEVFTPQRHRMENGTFIGQLSKGKPHGQGVMLYDDGSISAGQWQQGTKTGPFRQCDAAGQTSFVLCSDDQTAKPLNVIRDADVRYGIDLSHYQPEAWGAMLICVDKKGRLAKTDRVVHYRPVDFVLLKATEGQNMKDERYKYHSEMATALGIPQGSYHLWSASADVGKQVRNYLNQIKGINHDFPCILDIEGSSREVTAKDFKKQESRYIEWLQKVESSTHRQPIIYCCYDFYDHYGRNSKLSDYEFWIADYSQRSDRHHPCRLRQISDKGRLAGWASNVDVDVLQ